ncbi:acyltransferase family protein [Cumulibacter manganitolerans]|uniref:acyltransferase family protein n=1 Tax=Cumulibacter manganitolerans TaxID=1884992 RepID=UPI001296E583|nr:acyltransferase [Cumulibacter manganitolerans]
MTSADDTVTEQARAQWVDTLRVSLISGVIVVHAATAYVTDFAGYYYDDERVTSGVASVAFALPALMGGMFGLGPLFVVAGWFSVGSLARRGPAGFMAGRLVRLGVPMVVFVMVVNPLADYLGNLWDEDDASFLDRLGDTEFSIVWFVAALLACSIGYALVRSVRPLTHPGAPPDRRALVIAGALIAAGSLAVWQFTTLLDTDLLNVRLSAWPQAAVLFALGVRVAEARCDGRLSAPSEHRLGEVAAAGSVLTLVLVYYTGARDQLDSALGGFTWVSIAFASLYGIVSIAFTLWCVAWMRRRWPTHGSLMIKAGRGSYAAYLLHPVVLVCVMLAMRTVPLGAQLKFVIVSVIAIPVCFTVGYALSRLPGVRRVL